MAEAKTAKSKASVAKCLNAIEDPARRKDAKVVLKMMREVTGEKPAMWGPSIVGFGSYRYEYASGRSGEWPATGFSPRKNAMSLYIMPGFSHYASLMKKLGKHKTGKSCLYIKKLEDVDVGTLEELVRRSYELKISGG